MTTRQRESVDDTIQPTQSAVIQGVPAAIWLAALFDNVNGTVGATHFTLKSSAARRALSMLRTRRALSVVASNTCNNKRRRLFRLQREFEKK